MGEMLKRALDQVEPKTIIVPPGVYRNSVGVMPTDHTEQPEELVWKLVNMKTGVTIARVNMSVYWSQFDQYRVSLYAMKTHLIGEKDLKWI